MKELKDAIRRKISMKMRKTKLKNKRAELQTPTPATASGTNDDGSNKVKRRRVTKRKAVTEDAPLVFSRSFTNKEGLQQFFSPKSNLKRAKTN